MMRQRQDWPRVQLGDVCSITASQVDPRDPAFGKLPHVCGENIASGTGRLVFANSAQADGMMSPKYLFESGDILYSKIRPYLRKVVSVDFAGVCSADVYPLKVKADALDSTYAKWLLLSENFTAYAVAKSGRARMPKLNRVQLFAYRFKLPPLDEQRWIASRLAEQLASIERARSAAEAQLEAARKLTAALLRSVFETEQAASWPRMPLKSLLRSPLKTGISKTSSPDADKRCLTLSSVRYGELDTSASKLADVSDAEAEGSWVVPGRFYVVRGNGNLSLVGRGALAPASLDSPVLYPDLLIEVNVDPKSVLPTYLRWAWDSDEVRRDIERRAKTAAGIFKINQAELGAVCIPTPPIPEQERSVSALRSENSATRGLVAHVASQAQAIQALPAALLRRAFNGEL